MDRLLKSEQKVRANTYTTNTADNVSQPTTDDTMDSRLPLTSNQVRESVSPIGARFELIDVGTISEELRVHFTCCTAAQHSHPVSTPILFVKAFPMRTTRVEHFFGKTPLFFRYSGVNAANAVNLQAKRR